MLSKSIVHIFQYIYVTLKKKTVNCYFPCVINMILILKWKFFSKIQPKPWNKSVIINSVVI